MVAWVVSGVLLAVSDLGSLPKLSASTSLESAQPAFFVRFFLNSVARHESDSSESNASGMDSGGARAMTPVALAMTPQAVTALGESATFLLTSIRTLHCLASLLRKNVFGPAKIYCRLDAKSFLRSPGEHGDSCGNNGGEEVSL